MVVGLMSGCRCYHVTRRGGRECRRRVRSNECRRLEVIALLARRCDDSLEVGINGVASGARKTGM